MTWTGLILAMNTMSEGLIDLQLHLIENEVQRSKSIIGRISEPSFEFLPYGNELELFWITYRCRTK